MASPINLETTDLLHEATTADHVMRDEVLLKLSIAKQYAQHANFAGTPRQAIADGFSAIDAVFSSLLIHKGLAPPRNHKHKLRLVHQHFPNVLDPERVDKGKSSTLHAGADWASLEAFYEQWLASRYESIALGTAQASSRLREVFAVISCGVRYLARERGIEFYDFDKSISELAFGYEFSEVSHAVGCEHERLFYEAEVYGEMHGSKLGTKLAATTNYCEFDLISGDELTQAILKEDKEVAAEAAQLYQRFIKLVDLIDERRLDRISGGKNFRDCTDDELNRAPDFMLAMKARFHGGTVQQMAARWGKVLAKAFSSLTHPSPEGLASARKLD